MPNGWTIRSGDLATKLYALCMQGGVVLPGELATGTDIPGAQYPTEAALSGGAISVQAYLNSVIAVSGENVLLNHGNGYGGDSNHQGAIMFHCATAGPVLNVRLTAGGSGYTGTPTAAISGGGGSGATASVALSSLGGVKSVTISDGGTGYPDQSAVTFTGGGGSGATGVATVAPGGIILSVEITAAGTGYTSAPTPVFSMGSGAVATSTLGYPIGSITLTAAGTGYSTIPTVTISGNGTAATAVVDNIGTALAAGSYGVLIKWLKNGGAEYWPRVNLIPLEVTTAEAS